MAQSRGPTWEPSIEDYARIFAEQNPWHETGRVPGTWAQEVERPLAGLLATRLTNDRPRRFQLIIGPRRVGKTTSMYQTVKRLLEEGISKKSLWWLRLDHPLLMEISLGVLVDIIKSESRATADAPAFLFLDELTYASKWDLWLKTFYDETLPIRIVGTSSATAALRDRRLESGVGRWEEQYMSPYLFPEYLGLIHRLVSIPVGSNLSETLDSCIRERVDVSGLAEARRRFLLTGGFPELLIAGPGELDHENPGEIDDEGAYLLESQRTLRNDAVERAIYKDIPQVFDVRSPIMLERMLYTLAGQVTGILSPATICQTLGGLSQPTFDRYLSYLTRAFLVFTLPNYSGDESSRQRRGRKVYFVDGAVRNAALQRGLAPLTDPSEMGLLIENMVAGHLQALGEVGQVRLYHWRDKNDEIDLIFDHPEHPLAFEVGSSGRHHLRGVHEFCRRFPRFRGRCYLAAPGVQASRPEDNPSGVGALPLDLLLLAVGAQAERELRNRLGGR